MLYRVFHRVWWCPNPAWPQGREPHLGKRTIIAANLTWSEARQLCDEWNREHDPGRWSRKAEFEEQKP
jgi:hypothetical protein